MPNLKNWGDSTGSMLSLFPEKKVSKKLNLALVIYKSKI